MNNYVVYFEIGGKKMKMTVKALNEELAKRVVKDKIVFHKVKDAYDAIQETEAAKWKKIKETRDLPHVTAITQNRRN